MGKLEEGIAQIGFSGEQAEQIRHKMDLYIKEIQLFNKTANLVGTDDYDELAVNHVLDSLAGAPHFARIVADITRTENRRLTAGDFGSGSGFPGLVLASVFPDIDFVLIERMKKRCTFLENTAAILALKNVTVLNKDADKVPRESLDIAVFRAFRPLTSEMTQTIFSALKTHGVVMAYKARSEKIAEEMAGITKLVPSFQKIALTVPFLTENTAEVRERNLVIFPKQAVPLSF